MMVRKKILIMFKTQNLSEGTLFSLRKTFLSDIEKTTIFCELKTTKFPLLVNPVLSVIIITNTIKLAQNYELLPRVYIRNGPETLLNFLGHAFGVVASIA